MNKRIKCLISLTLAAAMTFSAGGAAMAGYVETPAPPGSDSIDYDAGDALVGIWSDKDPAAVDDPLVQAVHSAAFMARAASYPSYAETYNAMIALKEKYPEGMTWTNFTPYGRDSDPYQDAYWFKGGAVKGAKGGVGCAAFVFLLSDAAFDDIPAEVYDNGKFTYENIKVGDILRVNNSHFVIVLQKTAGGVVIAEANYNKSVHWGRTMSREEVMAANFIVTRYPLDYVDSDAPGADEEKVSGTEGNLTWVLTNGGTLTISGRGPMLDYNPNDNNMPSWNTHIDEINAIVIESGVTRIGAYAFYHGKALSVSIPNTVESIGDSAFEGCLASTGWSSNLVSVTIPGSVQSIGASSFRNCASLTSVSISEGLKTVGENAFRACTSLQYIDFPASITSIGAAAFTDCSKVVSIRFAPGTESVSVGENLFTHCWNLEYVTLPEKLNTISNGMFSGCNRLQYLCIPAGVEHIYEVGAIGDPPFSQTYISQIDFCGSEQEWNNKGGQQAVNAMNNGGAGVTVNFNATFNNPFAPLPDDPGDLVTDPTEPPDPTEHHWSTDWTNDTGYHWHECQDSDCPVTETSQKNGYAAHSFGDWVIDQEAAATTAGSRHRDCTVCAYRQTETVPATGTPAHQHVWSTNWNNSETHHWHECGSGGCTVTDDAAKSGYAAHSYGDWVIDTYATASQDGSRHRNCTICGYQQTDVIPATGSDPTPPDYGGNTDDSDDSNDSGGRDTSSAGTTPVPKPGDSTKPTIDTANPSGKTEMEVELSEQAINAAVQNHKPVPLPIAGVTSVKNPAEAVPITVHTGKNEPVKVSIPVIAPSAGTVAVIVNADGSTNVVKTSAVVDNGVIAPLMDGATVKIVDNSKLFSDVPAGAWSEDAVAFVSARELFSGITETAFEPDGQMTRAMLMTVLARLDGAATEGGDTWYSKGVEWAIANHISDGTDPNSGITREQLVTMLWRYLGSPEESSTLPGYTDAEQIGEYAQTAMRWAVKNGIVNGFGDSRLGPQEQATRAQVAQILKNLIEKLLSQI